MPYHKGSAGIPHRRCGLFRLILAAAALIGGSMQSRAELGLAREAFGVWDREGLHSVADYPYARGQSLSMSWAAVHKSYSGNYTADFDWTDLNVLLASADAQNQSITCSISPIGGSGAGLSMPSWMFGPLTATGGGLVAFSEVADPSRPTVIPASYIYAKYTEPQFKVYFEAAVKALAYKIRYDPATPESQRARIAFVRVDTGATGDEEPYENPSLIPSAYSISTAAWDAYRDWAFELYRKEFQDGPGRPIPLLFSSVEPVPGAPNLKWNWIANNVKSGFGTKHGGQLRGHHLSESESNVTVYKPLAVDSDFKFFSRNEMDQTWSKPYFALNVPLNMYWAGLEQLNVGMSIWDWSGTAMENADGTLKQFFDNGNFVFTGEFFNKWAAELDPATAGGGFCVFHEGLDIYDTAKFSTATYGNASWNNKARYTAICAAYTAQGAKMDDLNGATMGSVAQRDDTPGMIGFNDAGWKIHPGNYDRFITQLDPDNTSKALWRVGGTLTTTSHAYDRFARRSDTASGKNTMYFDINDNLLPSLGQRVQINVTYRNDTAGQFMIKYDGLSGNLTTLTVNKTGLGTGNTVWATASFEVTDWVFGNRQPTNSAPSGSDLQLVNVGPGDTIYHGIELIKLADISVGIIGSGTVTGRNNTAVFSALPTRVMEAQRLELKVTPAPGWQFTGWSGALTGSNPTPFLFPTKDTRLTATFSQASLASSMDNFNSSTWSGGTGWSGDWTTVGATKAGAIAELNGGSPTARITRTLNTPLTGATLSFDWDLDRLAANGSESGTVEVSTNGTTWQQVWTQNSRGTDVDGTANMLPSGNIALTGSIAYIRFTLNANGSGDTFLIDNLAISGTPVIAPNSAPQFSNEPIGKAAATVAQAYTGQTLAGSATDPNSNPLTYSKLSGGPTWLSVASNGSLSGTPAPTDAGLNRWTVQVSSTGGSETAILLINVVAPGPNPPSALSYPSLPVYTKGTAITNVIPTSSGGSVLRYVASPRLPKGLYLNSTTGSISGTPSEVSATATYTITATNTDGATTANVVITVNDISPSTLSYSANPANYTRGTAITANTPSSSGGVVLSYAVSPTLPAGLALNASTGIISGTPSAASSTTLYTVTATNTGGSTTAQVSIAVDSLGPVALAYSSNPAIYTKDVAIANNTPSNSGGAVVSYSVSPALPAGLTLNTAAGIISGTPTVITPSANYIVTATNANGSTTASLTITVNDAPPSAMTYSNNPAVYTVGTALTNTTRSTPTSSGGAVVSYSITPALPAGLSLNPTTTSTTFGASRGTPSAASPTTVYTVTATNTGGSTTATLTITVNAVVTTAPTNLTYSSNPATYTVGAVITNNTPTSGGGAVASYAVSPALPVGLTLDTTTGFISGTPTVLAPTATYSVTATNSFGSTSASVSITVNGIAPSALVYSTNPATYNKNTAITQNTPSSGGGAVASYAVSPTLPTGLTLNTSTGVISGTPTAVVPTATYTVTATNSFGATSASVSITVSDTIFTYSNSSLITIRDNNTALPYPSTITVPTTAGTIGKVTVQLNGLNHTYPGDVAMLLVGPLGQKFLLFYHNGAGTDAVNANLGFADSSSVTLPTAIVSGTYKPTTYSSGTYTFPSPAPAYPYLSGALSTFNGTNPTGSWSLYVRDDSNSDSGTLSGGWSLSFEITSPAVVAPSALTYSSNPATYTKGSVITNNTPTSSGGAVASYAVSPALPAGLTLNTSTGIISGTPTTLTAAANYTVTATNTGGSTPASVSIAVVSPYAAWAAQYGLVKGPEGDDDGDGNSNYFEFVAGLVPTNAGSVFKTTISSVPGQPSQRAIVFSPIISGRSYSVKSSESLQPATWTPLSGAISSDAGNERTVIDTAANEARKFYVVEISIP